VKKQTPSAKKSSLENDSKALEDPAEGSEQSFPALPPRSDFHLSLHALVADGCLLCRKSTWDSKPHPNSLRRSDTPEQPEPSTNLPRPRPKVRSLKKRKITSNASDGDVISVHSTDSEDGRRDRPVAKMPSKKVKVERDSPIPIVFDMEAEESGGEADNDAEDNVELKENEEDRAFIDESVSFLCCNGCNADVF
jgi:hypothetical protein